MTRKTFERAKQKLSELVSSWGKANVYMVGGCVRDVVMGLPPKDIDLCVDYPNGAEVFCEYLKENHPETCKNFVVFLRYGTSKFTLVLGGKELDIECVMPRTETYQAGPRKPDSVAYTSLEIDATRRDFCCNALYMNVLDDTIIDPIGRGLSDVENKILKTPLDPEATFTDDPLRMLRAVRFAWQKGFKIDPEVEKKITDYPEYYKLSKERIRDEFVKILKSSNPEKAIWFLHDHHLLKYIIPEFDEAWGFNQNNHHHSMNLTDHCLEVLRRCRQSSDDISLLMAALLHDISKYKHYKVKDSGEFSFICHDLDSAEMSEAIMYELRFSEAEISKTKFLVRHHLCIKPYYDRMTGKYNRGGATSRKIARLLGDLISEEMILIDADNHAHAPGYQMPGQVESFWENYQAEVVNTLGKLIQPVSGREIMTRLNVLQGKVIGEIKSIFQLWIDENPELTNDELFQKYESEFSGKSLWISEFLDRYKVSENKQVLNSYGLLFPEPYEIFLEIPKSDLPTLPTIPGKSAIQVKAREYPILYRRWVSHKKFREVLEKLNPILSEVSSIPGSGRLKLEYHDGDLTGSMEWEGHATEYIM